MGLKDKDAYNAYMRQYMLARYHQRRREAIVLLGGKCIDCGHTDDLEFDHVIPKEIDIGKVWSYNKDRFIAELNKCVLRCSSCHKRKSRKYDWNIVEHGGGVSGKNRCKCELCRKRKAEYMRNWRKTHKGR